MPMSRTPEAFPPPLDFEETSPSGGAHRTTGNVARQQAMLSFVHTPNEVDVDQLAFNLPE
jgi:hypothetical protein